MASSPASAPPVELSGSPGRASWVQARAFAPVQWPTWLHLWSAALLWGAFYVETRRRWPLSEVTATRNAAACLTSSRQQLTNEHAERSGLPAGLAGAALWVTGLGVAWLAAILTAAGALLVLPLEVSTPGDALSLSGRLRWWWLLVLMWPLGLYVLRSLLTGYRSFALRRHVERLRADGHQVRELSNVAAVPQGGKHGSQLLIRVLEQVQPDEHVVAYAGKSRLVSWYGRPEFGFHPVPSWARRSRAGGYCILRPPTDPQSCPSCARGDYAHLAG